MHFQIILVYNTVNDSKFIELQSYFVNFNENHRTFQGGLTGKMIGRGMPNILLFVLYPEGWPLRRQTRFKFYLNKV